MKLFIGPDLGSSAPVFVVVITSSRVKFRNCGKIIPTASKPQRFFRPVKRRYENKSCEIRWPQEKFTLFHKQSTRL